MSRLTFRNAAGDVAWQKQLRDHYEAEGVPPVPHLDIKRAVVRPVSRKLAEQIILKYEWLGTMPIGVNFFYGLFFGSYCAGVCCFCVGGGGANINAHVEFGVKKEELAYLARGANVHWSPKGANSKLVTWACRLVGRDSGAKLALAYSDTDAGEIGTIYQASNWICVGRGASTRQWVAPNGRIYDQKYAYDLRRRDGFRYPRRVYVNALRAAGWTEQPSNAKYRYVYVLDKSDRALVELVESKRQPYPKRQTRAGSADSGTSTDQVEGGGAIPTPALSLDAEQVA